MFAASCCMGRPGSASGASPELPSLLNPFVKQEESMKASTLALSLALGLATSLSLAQQAGGSAAGAPAATQYKSPKLDRAQVDALLAKPDQLVVIDVRRPDELTSIGGFPVYLSIQSRELAKNLAFIPKDRTVITVSNHAGRALGAADLLADKGFRVAGAIGAQDYEAAGGTLTKIVPPPPRAAAVPGAVPGATPAAGRQ
jgi:rhodanese-related sulfurtransferase